MSKRPPYADQTREQISKSNLNKSTAKTLWSFSKRQRFIQNKSVCPHASYQYNLSTISKIKTGFGSSKRKVFTESSDAPPSWNYNPSKPVGYRPFTSFGFSRQKCHAGSYLAMSVFKNPAPNKYLSQVYQQKQKGYTMRPKTAYQKTYFIDNKQQRPKPSPFYYNITTDKNGVAAISKFKTVVMGSVSLQSKAQRFKDPSFVTPSPNLYVPQKYAINKYSKNGKINVSDRKSFIDDTTNSEFTPGPGKYRMPTDFGHYTYYRHSRLSAS